MAENNMILGNSVGFIAESSLSIATKASLEKNKQDAIANETQHIEDKSFSNRFNEIANGTVFNANQISFNDIPEIKSAQPNKIEMISEEELKMTTENLKLFFQRNLKVYS